MAPFFQSPRQVFLASILLRVGLLGYGVIQDEFMPMKYTDIDYFVFTDAASFVARGQSPYARDTYRYTPLLAWLIYPTTWSHFWFPFGKLLFAAGDIVAGFLIYRALQSSQRMAPERALKFASIWLLNPMVAQISTRGSSEGFLCVIVVSLLWAVLGQRNKVAGFLLGFAIHFKIYPFIYAVSIFLWMGGPGETLAQLLSLRHVLSRPRVELVVTSMVTFVILNGAMFACYGWPFLEHSYFYHITRTDHRHNFSPYNMVLYQDSAAADVPRFNVASLAFLPQLALSFVLIPLATAKRDLAGAMLAQTYCFVTFNKVCTSQYFLWYLVFLPFYLPSSSLLKYSSMGIPALALWVLGQAVWLQQGYQLEFLGRSAFFPGIWSASIAFFLVNVGILGAVLADLMGSPSAEDMPKQIKSS